MASGTSHCSTQEQPGVITAKTRPSSREIRPAGKAKQQAIIVTLRRQLHEMQEQIDFMSHVIEQRESDALEPQPGVVSALQHQIAVMEMVIRDQQLEIYTLELQCGQNGHHNAVFFDMFERPDVHDASTLTDISLKFGDDNLTSLLPPSTDLIDGMLDADAAAGGGYSKVEHAIVEDATPGPLDVPDDLIFKDTVQYVNMRVPKKVIQYSEKESLCASFGAHKSQAVEPSFQPLASQACRPDDVIPGQVDFDYNASKKTGTSYSEAGFEQNKSDVVLDVVSHSGDVGASGILVFDGQYTGEAEKYALYEVYKEQILRAPLHTRIQNLESLQKWLDKE